MDFSPMLFKRPFMANEKILVKPYKEFAKNFHIGLSDGKAKIAVRQRAKQSVFDSPPDHPFVLDLLFESTGETEWISLEGKIDVTEIRANARCTALISVMGSNDKPLVLDLRLNLKNGPHRDIRLGEVTPGQGNNCRAVTVSRTLEEAADVLDANEVVSAFLLVFFPVSAPEHYSLSMLNLFVTESELA